MDKAVEIIIVQYSIDQEQMARVVSGGFLLFSITMQCLHIEVTVFSKPNNDDDHGNNPNLLNINYMLGTVLALSYTFSYFIFKVIL